MSGLQNAPVVRAIRHSFAVVLLGLTSVSSAEASPGADLSLICDQVAAEASRRTGVPVAVLQAISLTETGRKRSGAVRPWPWTVNMEGKGVWFETEDEARAYVYKEYKRGARSFDVGCFQINYKWHGKAFRSIEEMFDPLANALYAARFLTELYTEQGSWGKAAGAYHSRTPEYANRYQARFERFHSKLAANHDSDIPEIPDIVRVANDGAEAYANLSVPRINRYPLLQTGNVTGLGSLVPLGNGGGASLFPGTAQPSEVN